MDGVKHIVVLCKGRPSPCGKSKRNGLPRRHGETWRTRRFRVIPPCVLRVSVSPWLSRVQARTIETGPLHLVFAELFFGQAFQPLLDAADVHGVLAGLGAAGALDHG